MAPGQKNLIYTLLVYSEKMYLPPMHIKLRLMKNFLKFMDRTNKGFTNLKAKSPSVSNEKRKEDIILG